MTRIPFSQVLKNANIDLHREYDRLYNMFYIQRLQDGTGHFVTLKDCCEINFLNIPFRGTCVSLDDFNDYFNFHFEKVPSHFNIDYLVSFCEYSYNLAMYSQGIFYGAAVLGSREPMSIYIQQVLTAIETIGYMENTQNGITDFIPKDQAAISVAEIVDSNLSYRVIEYNHHSLKGDLDRKRAILLALGDKLEPQRAKLKQINNTFESDLFYIFNSMNIRHNNAEPGGKNYIAYVETLSKEEIEQWYDDTYQMCLLAFLELDQVERRSRIKELKQNI